MSGVVFCFLTNSLPTVHHQSQRDPRRAHTVARQGMFNLQRVLVTSLSRQLSRASLFPKHRLPAGATQGWSASGVVTGSRRIRFDFACLRIPAQRMQHWKITDAQAWQETTLRCTCGITRDGSPPGTHFALKVTGSTDQL